MDWKWNQKSQGNSAAGVIGFLTSSLTSENPHDKVSIESLTLGLETF